MGRLSHPIFPIGGTMNQKMFSKTLLAAAVGGLAISAAAEDYTTGTIRAVIQDQSGAAQSDATVVVTSDRGVRRSAVSDSQGKIRIPQLPIGNYTVTVTRDGFDQLVSENVPVKLGGDAELTFTLAALNATIEEVYVVGVKQDNWDFNSTTAGLTIDVGDIFNKTPIGRDAGSLALLAPGTNQGDTAFSTDAYGASGTVVSMGGASVGENVYYVNGMNVTNFKTFVGGSTVPFEFYEQLEVKTGGYQAEFGRSTGGVTNAVTRSGSNEFHFGVNAYFEPDSLSEHSPATFRTANQFNETDSKDYNIWASGPVIKDKLYFFALYNPRKDVDMLCDNGTCTETTRDDPFYGGKLDFIPMDGHRLEYTYWSDDQDAKQKNWRFTQEGKDALLTGDADQIAALTRDQVFGQRISDSNWINGGKNHIVKYTAAVTDWFTVSALYGRNDYKRQNLSPVNAPVLQDQTGGGAAIDTGVWSVGSFQEGEDQRVAKRIDADFYFDAMGEHHIRIGWDQEDLESYENTYYSGNLVARLQNSGTSSTGQRWRTRQYYNEGNFETTQSALYIQDSWQALENLTINFGLRNETFENKNMDGDVFLETSDQLAARAGFSWDPTNDGRSRVYGSYGRYYLPIATNTNVRLAGRETYFQEYYESVDSDSDGVADLDANGFPVLGPIIGSRLYFADGTLGFPEAQSTEGLDPMYQDEYMLGFEYNLADEWTVGIRYTTRDLKSLIEDVAVDAAVIAWANANGYGSDPALATYSGFHQYVLINPGKDIRVAALEDFGNDGVVDYMDLSAEDLGYPKGKRTYDAIDLTLEREWDGKWMMWASYTWSESKGNYEGSVKSDTGQDDAGLTTDFDQPGLLDGAEGYLPNDRRHRVKVRGAYAITEQIQVNANINVEAPRKFGCIGEHPTDYFAWAYGAYSWFCGGESTPRGSQLKSDWIKTVDVGLSYAPDLGDMPGQFVIRLDVFNLFDSDAVVDIHEFGDIGFTSTTALGGTGIAAPDEDYGKPRRYQSPRSVRLGLSYNF